ncbi:MAG: hypothetical protein JWN52_7662 [Actinomycetia bacterium]|nr:hypothetical protein [Actinomycetes bacterium]
MRHPDQVVASLAARHPDWTILSGGSASPSDPARSR